MTFILRKPLCLSLALFLVVVPVTRAQQPGISAPIPPQIASAHTVFVSNGGGPSFFNVFTGGADRGYDSFYAALKRWNRYQFVTSPSQADLIFEIRSVAPAVDVSGAHGSSTVEYSPQLILRILDPKTNTILWTTTANVRAGGRQRSRDRGFDQSVAVLVDQLRQITGEQLDPTQLKAIHSNSETPTGVKVLFAVGIAAVVVSAIVGIHFATSHSTPKLPTQPACTGSPFCPVV